MFLFDHEPHLDLHPKPHPGPGFRAILILDHHEPHLDLHLTPNLDLLPDPDLLLDHHNILIPESSPEGPLVGWLAPLWEERRRR